MRIILHIGAGKCASSSLQEHFSYNSIQENFAYATVLHNGELLCGKQMEEEAIKCVDNCLSSRTLLRNLKNEENFAQNLEQSLKIYAKHYDTLLLSCEAWHRQAKDFEDIAPIFNNYEVEIIFIVRPFVEWYNSAWWQWYNWDKGIKNIDAIINLQHFKNNEWDRFYEEFANLSFVKKVHMLSLNEDIIKQVYDIINIPYKIKAIKKSNISSSAELLAFLSKNIYLRPIHAPFYEIILNKYLQKRTKTPWTLSEANIAKLLEISNKSALNIAQYIKNENILDNPLWWNVNAYKDKQKDYHENFILEDTVLLNMLEEAQDVCDRLILHIQNLLQGKNLQKSKEYALCHENLLNILNVKKEVQKANYTPMEKLARYYTLITELDRFNEAIIRFI